MVSEGVGSMIIEGLLIGSFIFVTIVVVLAVRKISQDLPGDL